MGVKGIGVKKYISNDINGRINRARKNMYYGKEILPRSVKVEWVVDENNGRTYDIKEGEFVVCLNRADCQERNVVNLATAVVKRTSLLGVRHVVQDQLQTSIDMNLVKNILREINNKKILDWFFSEEYSPTIKKEKEIEEWNNKIVEIDEKGMFTKILLIELDEFAKKIVGHTPRPFMFGQIEDLVKFLYKIATKEYGEDVPLRFRRAHIRIGIILVANTSKLLHDGIEPYVKAVTYDMERECDSVYVIIFDKDFLGEINPQDRQEFIDLTNSLNKAILDHSMISKDYELNYICRDPKGRKRNTKCIRYIIEYTHQ